MILKQYYAAFGAFTVGAAADGCAKTQTGSAISGAGLKGASFTSFGALSKALPQPKTSYSAQYGVVFGTGTTPPTLDDYKLSGDLVTTLVPVAAVSNDASTDGTSITAVYTITNTGAEPVTIGEVAAFYNINNGSTASNAMLIDRTVLDEPVTVPAGGVGQITYTIKMVYPTD